MRVVAFTHSLLSCWNHGNAHFLRGVLRELALRGHDVAAFEPEAGWSRANLIADHGMTPLSGFRRRFPELLARTYRSDFDPAEALDGADLVLVHEWNDPALVASIGALRAHGAQFVLLFHDTHHRAVSDPAAMQIYDLSGYDGVLAFGAALAEVYRRRGWGKRAFVWHEAADARLFRPPARERRRHGLVWIGNWGDEERTAELRDYLLEPASACGLALDVHGVRYPAAALGMLGRFGARYHGWLPNAEVPETFAHHLATVHVPRRFYAGALPGIPTIRVFEALACGIPLLSAPWDDTEGLFRAGQDFLMAASPADMRRHMRAVANDAGLRDSLTANGLAAITARHTCAHRADELIAIAERISAPVMAPTEHA